MTKKEVKENFQKFRRCCLNITQYDCDGNDDFSCESSCPYYMSNEKILETLKAVEDILESVINTRMYYYDAIEFLSKNNIYRAIRDLSVIAEERQTKTAKMMAELIAEKRCVRNFVESKELTTEMKIDAIDKVTGEE